MVPAIDTSSPDGLYCPLIKKTKEHATKVKRNSSIEGNGIYAKTGLEDISNIVISFIEYERFR